MNNFALTSDQEAALLAFQQFMVSDIETVFILSGYSGCGKTALVKHIIASLPSFYKTIKLVDPDYKEFIVQLTATTNKAAENLQRLSGEETKTIHSFLGLIVHTDYKTGITTLTPKKSYEQQEGFLIFIDEASYIDSALLTLIFSKTKNCKIVFIGDPAQLTPVKATTTPVFNLKYTGAQLSQVVRQAEGNPIIELSTKFRNTVNTGKFFQFTPDGHHIQHMGRDDFNTKIIQEFTRPDWHFLDSKILAWTNKRVTEYNNFIQTYLTGDPEFQIGDYVICNSYLSIGGRAIKTDQMVEITDISADYELHGVMGNKFTLDNYVDPFMPKTITSRKARIKLAKAENNLQLLAEIDNLWVDLRAAQAITINKSQGSTFGSVFIDLSDIGKCNSGNQIARMAYVAVSRAKNHVYLVGDLF